MGVGEVGRMEGTSEMQRFEGDADAKKGREKRARKRSESRPSIASPSSMEASSANVT